MNAITNRWFYAELHKLGLKGEDLRNAIYGFTNGRTSSSKDLSDLAGKDFVRAMQAFMRKPATAQEPEQSAVPATEPIAKPIKAAWQPPDDEANKRRRHLLYAGYQLGWSRQKVIDWATSNAPAQFNKIPIDELRKKIGKLQTLLAERNKP